MFSKLVRVVALAVVCLLLSLPLSAQTVSRPQSSPKSMQPKPKVEMATWAPYIEELIGLKEADFASMGLSKLTEAEYVQFFSWAAQREAAVKEAALRSQLTYSCGPTRQKPEDYDKVRIFLDLPNDAPSELASPIRQGLRAIKDVEIVFSSREADRSIGFLASQTKNVGGVTTGYTVTYIVTTPCLSKIADQTFDLNDLDNHVLQGGGTNAKEMADRVVADLDAHDIEAARQLNSALKKTLQK